MKSTSRRSCSFAATIPYIFVLALLLQTGCALTPFSTGRSQGERRDSGFAVVSLSRTGLPSAFSMQVNLRGVDRQFTRSFAVSDLFAPAEWGCSLLKTTYDDSPCGSVAVIELPPGEYEFFSWEGKAGGGPGEMTFHVRSGADFSKRFTVIGGKTVYLGNLHFAMSAPSIDSLLRGGDEPYRIYVMDMSQRDLPMLFQKLPRITADSVLVSILSN